MMRLNTQIDKNKLGFEGDSDSSDDNQSYDDTGDIRYSMNYHKEMGQFEEIKSGM